MLTVSGLSKSFGIRPLFQNVSFAVNRDSRLGIVGPNGCGKSTLLRILAGLEQPDSGSVAMSKGTRVGYLAQGELDLSERTVASQVRSGIPGLGPARLEVDAAAARMAVSDIAGEAAAKEYERAVAGYDALGGFATDTLIEHSLRAVGMDGLEHETPLAELSGGQQTRIGIARLLIAAPGLLLLDEPTNHLDIESLQWLETFVSAFEGGVILVSHDREFLNRCVTRILALDDETLEVGLYSGGYDEFAAERERELARADAEYRDQQAEIRRVEADIRRTRDQAQRTESATTNDYWRGRAKKVARKAKSRQRRLERYLDSEDRVAKPRQRWQMKIDFAQTPRGAQFAVRLQDAAFAFGDAPVLAHCDIELRYGEKVAVMGVNGSGKSTLFRLIGGDLEPTHGVVKVGAGIQIGFLRQDRLDFEPGATPLSVIQGAGGLDETASRTYLHHFLFKDDEPLVQIDRLSFGERVRLSLASLIVRGANMLLLDEPMNHLDIESREKLEAALSEFSGPVVAVTHDRAFARRFAERIWWLEPKDRGHTVVSYGSVDDTPALALRSGSSN
ncbi:MAG: ABC-F family ATP-binding cassette domain-containing protein [Chloroflexi bacterium]|nr:ABC-F family ATP-binding cassette domain-containing protein [Chloroflexota bacterium]